MLSALRAPRGFLSTIARQSAAAFYQLILLAAVLWFGYEFALNAKANLEAQKITSGFGFLENTAGFGVNQSLIPYNESDTYGTGLPGRPSQHAAGRRRRDRARDHPRLPHRHRAAVAQLARSAAGWRLCRIDSQSAAPVPNPVLVSRRAWHAAGTAPKHLAVRRGFHQQPRNHRPRPGGGGGRRRGLCHLRRRRSRCHRTRALGEAPADPHRPRVPAGVDQFGADRRPAACGPCGDGRPDRVCETGAPRLQFYRRGPADPGIRRAPARAHDLHRRVHRRDRPRRDPCGPAGPDARRRWRSACGVGRRCGSSSCRRRCG